MTTSKRVPSTTLETDRDTLFAIQGMDDYTAVSPEYAKATLEQFEAELTQDEQAEARAWLVYEAARDRATRSGHRFHDAIVRAKLQIIAQYGKESNAVKAIGLKKKSEHKRPAKRATPKLN